METLIIDTDGGNGCVCDTIVIAHMFCDTEAAHAGPNMRMSAAGVDTAPYTNERQNRQEKDKSQHNAVERQSARKVQENTAIG